MASLRSSGQVAHPLVVPLPPVVAPAGSVLRRLAVSRLRALWRGGRLDLVMPTGEVVRLGGSGPADARARIHDDRLWLRMILRGEMGAGESYVAGEWSADDLPGVIRLFLRATDARGFESPLTWLAQLPALLRHRRRANTPAGSARNIHAHYDLGNAFYRLFLDDATLSYSCGLYESPGAAGARSSASPERCGATIAPDDASLADAQRAKLDRLCDLLALSPRDHLLEIGCGWGGMAIHAARTRGCRVTAITVSREQLQLAQQRVADAGLGGRVDIQLRDYRDVAGAYDKAVSIEMVEAVGDAYLPGYFAAVARALPRGGRFALQSITIADDRFDAYRKRVDWMQTYIFPGALIPSLAAIRAASPGFAIAAAYDIGPSYAPTLRAWRARFVERLAEVHALGFDAPFVRTWLMYLAFSEAAFAERTLSDHQLLLVRE